MDYAKMLPDEWPALVQVLAWCFGLSPERWESFRERVGDEHFRVAKHEGRVVGGLGVYRAGQVFGGRRVPLGGLAAVGVAPEFRGARVAAGLVTDTLLHLREDGVPLAGLYASTQRLYRSVGFEQAGNRIEYELALRSIDVVDRALPAAPASEEAIHALYRPEHGNLDRSAGLWMRIFQSPEGLVSKWTLGDQGYVVLGQEKNPGGWYDLRIRDWQALTPAAARRAWTLIGDHSSLAKLVRWHGPATDPMVAHLSEQAWRHTGQHRWMLRILDVPGVLEARGWPAGEGELHLAVDDPAIPANSGAWILEVGDGRARVRRGGRGELRMGIRGLAPLFSGLFDASALRRVGLLEGSDSAVALAGRLFAGPEPWMPEMY
jgi:predicted acetyltransferase